MHVFLFLIIPLQANREFAATYPATKFIQKYVPNARLLEQIGSEVIYVLPTDDPAVVKKFEQLFAVLDRYMAKLKIKSYGLSDTTLEEVTDQTVLDLVKFGFQILGVQFNCDKIVLLDFPESRE